MEIWCFVFSLLLHAQNYKQIFLRTLFLVIYSVIFVIFIFLPKIKNNKTTLRVLMRDVVIQIIFYWPTLEIGMFVTPFSCKGTEDRLSYIIRTSNVEINDCCLSRFEFVFWFFFCIIISFNEFFRNTKYWAPLLRGLWFGSAVFKNTNCPKTALFLKCK
jgi:hypothetical protein